MKRPEYTPRLRPVFGKVACFLVIVFGLACLATSTVLLALSLLQAPPVTSSTMCPPGQWLDQIRPDGTNHCASGPVPVVYPQQLPTGGYFTAEKPTDIDVAWRVLADMSLLTHGAPFSITLGHTSRNSFGVCQHVVIEVEIAGTKALSEPRPCTEQQAALLQGNTFDSIGFYISK